MINVMVSGERVVSHEDPCGVCYKKVKTNTLSYIECSRGIAV